MNPVRRFREARAKAAQTDIVLDRAIARTQVAYNDLFKVLIRTQEELRAGVFSGAGAEGDDESGG